MAPSKLIVMKLTVAMEKKGKNFGIQNFKVIVFWLLLDFTARRMK